MASTVFSWSSEDWLNKVGIGLVLFGLIFLFKYAIDKAWLTPLVRVLFGAGLGVLLLGVGLRIRQDRHRLGQVLQGGGIATFYVTLFAAFQLYSLLPYGIAFACMVGVTLLAFGLSVWQADALLAVIGTLGGLGTPYLLYTGGGEVAALVGYTCLLLVCPAVLYLKQGWRSLLWTAALGGWLSLGIAVADINPNAPVAERWIVQASLIFAWVVFWGVPLLRDVLQAGRPSSPPQPVKKWRFVASPVHLLTVTAPLITLGGSRFVWSLAESTWGWVAFGVCLFYGLLAWWLRVGGLRRLAATHALSAAVLFTLGCSLLFEGEVLLLALTAEAVAVHLLAGRFADPLLRWAGHILFLSSVAWLIDRLFTPVGQMLTLLSSPSLSALAVIVAGAGVSFAFSETITKNVYRLAAHVFMLGWFFQVFVHLPAGQAYVSVAWGVYAVVLLIFGLRLDLKLLRHTAFATFLLIVAKLFLVDLAEVAALWRVLLFLGFGGLFLLLSYFLPNLWKHAE